MTSKISWSIRLGTITAIGVFALAYAPTAMTEDAKTTGPMAISEPKPQETTGISLEASSTLELGAQIPALKGYALQIRTIVLHPGAVAGYHSHAKRPVVAYLVNGNYTEHRDGQGVVVHKPGEQWVEGADVAHWSENRGTETTYLINVEVFSTR
jgi:quercetin dioxygenase-like cupin family protein